MQRAKVKITVIPSDVDKKDIVSYNPKIHGSVLSTIHEIKVNAVQDGQDKSYGIIYNTNDFGYINIDDLGNNIIKLVMTNLPDTHIMFTIDFLYNINIYDTIYSKIDDTTLNKLIDLETKLCEVNDKFIHYSRSVNITNLLKIISEEMDYYDDEDDDEEDEYDDYEYDESHNSTFNNYFESLGIMTGNDYNTEDDDEEDDSDIDIIGYKGKPSKNYSQSKILREDKNAKRSYKRHGVLISTSKKARKHDEKIIKEFLNDFIPGDNEWKREFRNNILKRWMKSYQVSKSKLKELEKAHQKANRNKSKKTNKNLETALDITSRIFNRSPDRWNDPSK